GLGSRPPTFHRFPVQRTSASGWISFPIPLRGSSGFSPDSLVPAPGTGDGDGGLPTRAGCLLQWVIGAPPRHLAAPCYGLRRARVYCGRIGSKKCFIRGAGGPATSG